MISFKLGLIINPYAGIGGSVGLKGSDGDEIRAQALALGAEARALTRVERCLAMLQEFVADIQIYCFAGDMGETSRLYPGGFRLGSCSRSPRNLGA